MSDLVMEIKEPADLVALIRKTISRLITAADKQTLKLQVPDKEDQMRIDRNMHFHLNPEIFIQLSGRSIMNFPKQKLNMYPGTFSIIPRGIPHGETCRTFKGPFYNLVLLFKQNKLNLHLSREGENSRPVITAIEHFKAPAAGTINGHLDKVVDLYQNAKKAKASHIKGLLLVALSEMLEVVQGKSIASQEEHFKIAQCKRLVAANLADHSLSVKQLANWIKCSSDYLSNLFRLETGERLSWYINQQRIQHARNLLKTTSLNISEIAWASGYFDPGYFIRVFKKNTGHTPKEYRKDTV